MDSSFYGEYIYQMDEKGRIALPSTFRNCKINNGEIISENWVITRGFEKCLLLYPKENWEEVIHKFKDNLLYKNRDDRIFMRFFIFPAKEVSLDKQGRFMIPKSLLSWGNISKEVVLLGAIQKIEIWSSENWGGYQNTSEDQIESLAHQIKDFDF